MPAGRRAPLLQWAGSLFFTGFFLLGTFLYAIPFVLLSAVSPFPRRFQLARFYARMVLWVLKWSCALDYRIETAQKEANRRGVDISGSLPKDLQSGPAGNRPPTFAEWKAKQQ